MGCCSPGSNEKKTLDMGRRKSPLAIREHFRILAGKKKANCNGFMESGSERLKVVNTEASWYKRGRKSSGG